MMRCIIVDDEQPAIDVLVTYVQQSPLLQLAGTFTNPLEALKTVSEDDIDLVFLDVQMPEISGMDFIHAINGKSHVILTTAYSEFALKGYELDVIDYLVKPVRLPRFLQAVQKAAARMGEKKESSEITKSADHIFVKTGTKGKLQRIDFESIDYIEGMKNYVAFVSGKNKTLVYASMKEVEDHLPKDQFLRIHRSFIIPVRHIMGIEGNAVRLKNVDAEILIGENYKAELMAIISGRTI